MAVIPFRPRKPKDVPVVPVPKKAPNIVDVGRAYILAALCIYAIPIMTMIDFFQNGNAPFEVPPEDRNYD